MTAKRGTQWKTSWRRQKPAIGTAPQNMWWFTTFGVGPNRLRFEQPLPAPTIGDLTAPFWIGAIFGSTFFHKVASESIVARAATFPGLQSWGTSLVWDLLSLQAKAEALGGGYLTLEGGPLTRLGAIQTPPLPTPPVLVRGVLQMLVVEPVPAGMQASLWVDGVLRDVAVTGGAYSPSTGPVYLQPGFGFLNSMAGGNALPTTQEIQDWFSASRYALPYPMAQPIPGKTLDQFDAAATPAVVPPVLANLAGGQPAPLVSIGVPPVAVNILVPTTFGF